MTNSESFTSFSVTSCRSFAENIFDKSKCKNCMKPREDHVGLASAKVNYLTLTQKLSEGIRVFFCLNNFIENIVDKGFSKFGSQSKYDFLQKFLLGIFAKRMMIMFAKNLENSELLRPDHLKFQIPTAWTLILF